MLVRRRQALSFAREEREPAKTLLTPPQPTFLLCGLRLRAPSLARSFARTLIRPLGHCSLLRRPALRSRSVTPQHVQEGGELRVWDQRDGAPEPQRHEERLGVDRDDEGPEERPQNVAEPGLANGDQNLLEDDLEAEVKVPARKGWVSLHT